MSFQHQSQGVTVNNMFRRLKLKYCLLTFLVIFLVDWNVGLRGEVSDFARYIRGVENTSEVEAFLVRKERQYAARRDRVNRYCSEHRRDQTCQRCLTIFNSEANTASFFFNFFQMDFWGSPPKTGKLDPTQAISYCLLTFTGVREPYQKAYRSDHRDSSFSRNLKKMLHNPELNITVCLIPKVASTTWLGYFAALGEEAIFPYFEIKLWNLFREQNDGQKRGCCWYVSS